MRKLIDEPDRRRAPLAGGAAAIAEAPPAPDPAAVLAKATARAAALLGLSGAALARVLGVSEPTVSRLLRGQRGLDPASKEGELAVLLVRLCRTLDALVGHDDAKRTAWMNHPHRVLGGIPRELIERVEGLVAASDYLDGMRAPS